FRGRLGTLSPEWTMFSASDCRRGGSKLWTQGLWCPGACRGGNPNPRTRWWTPEVRDAVRLKKESYWTMLACGTPDAFDRYRQAAARTVLEAKTQVWEEFGEAMEEDYRSAWKRFWQTCPAPQKGEAVLCQHCLQCGWGAVDLDWGHCYMSDGWKEYFEDLLNPTDLPSSEEAEAGDSEVDSSITQAEVTEVVQQAPLWQGAWGWMRSAMSTSSPWMLWGIGSGGAFAKGCSVSVWTGAGAWFALPAPGAGGSPVWEPQDFHLCFLQMMLSCWIHQARTQHVLAWFAAECEAAGMRISTSKSETMVLDRKRVAYPLRVGGEVLYLGVLFTSEGKMEREIDRRIDWCSIRSYAVGVPDVVVKKELSRKVKLSIYRSIYTPTLPMVMNFG
ncbi:hypothetical protein L3Q82_026103, partial [Scortum barcoo]